MRRWFMALALVLTVSLIVGCAKQSEPDKKPTEGPATKTKADTSKEESCKKKDAKPAEKEPEKKPAEPAEKKPAAPPAETKAGEKKKSANQ